LSGPADLPDPKSIPSIAVPGFCNKVSDYLNRQKSEGSMTIIERLREMQQP